MQLFRVKQHGPGVFRVYRPHCFRAVCKAHRHGVVAHTYAVALPVFHGFPGLFHGTLARISGRVLCPRRIVPDICVGNFRCLLLCLLGKRAQGFPGLAGRGGQLHAVLLRKGRTVRLVGRVRGKQIDGLARQGIRLHGGRQLLHRRVLAAHRRGRILPGSRFRSVGIVRLLHGGGLVCLLPCSFSRLHGPLFQCPLRCRGIRRPALGVHLHRGSRFHPGPGIQRPAHGAQPRAHGTAQGTGGTACQAALQRLPKGIAL